MTNEGPQNSIKNEERARPWRRKVKRRIENGVEEAVARGQLEEKKRVSECWGCTLDQSAQLGARRGPLDFGHEHHSPVVRVGITQDKSISEDKAREIRRPASKEAQTKLN